MAIPAVSPARIDEALDSFDRDERASPKWQNWEENGNFKYAIAKNARLYPVKEIIAQATDISVLEFSGGAEANGHLRKLGFKIEALRLPTRSEVLAALHDLLIARAPSAVEPADAYRNLADHFDLPEQLRTKLMENSNENHWQNRVRQARRDLVEGDVIDPSEHGKWRIVLRSRPAVWIEKTLVQGRVDRADGPEALGRALWSPLRAQNGADIYRNMRRVQPNDIVLHLTDNDAFTGRSVVNGFARADFVGIDGTSWAGLPCYRVPLRDHRMVIPPLTRAMLETDIQVRERLIEIRRAHSNLYYDPNLQLHQGGYLTEAPDALVSLLDLTYRNQTGHHLVDTDVLKPLASIEAAQPGLREMPPVPSLALHQPQRVWLYAPGPKAVYWDDFRERGIAAIGWEETGDLNFFRDAVAVKARMDQVFVEPQSLVNANQCFDFAHRMNPGDGIFVKKGRREIIGFGIVKSDYRFEPDRPFYGHVRDVAWQSHGSWPTATHRLLSMKTLTEITDDETLIEELEQLIGALLPPPTSREPATKLPTYTVEDFSAETAIPQETIELWLARLKRKQQLIFQGPPGTGKTYVAERLAKALTGDTYGFVDVVQFHPSYGYKDFMHGIRPVTEGGRISFERVPGRFLRFCKAARDVPDKSPCVLIIDEINRGNLSRIFGELMYLLEYRDQTIPLAGEEVRFGIPPNVYLIGAMNTADRSIALVDHALRRRFSFIHLAPDYDVLRSQLEKHNLIADGLLAALRAANAAIDDRNYEIGISFFLKDGAALRSTLRDIWEGEIEPYLEEYFYDQPGKLEPLRWQALSKNMLASWSQPD